MARASCKCARAFSACSKFAKLVGNIAEDSGKLTGYLLSHAALQPYQAGKSGYAAVQNGRYILEVDSEGMFFFRRRHY